MRYAVAIVTVFVCASAFASSPGEPLDCGEWALLEPGHTCTVWSPFPCTYPGGCVTGTEVVVDNSGRRIWVEETNGWGCNVIVRIMASDGVNKTEIARLTGRCNPDSSGDGAEVETKLPLQFDPQNGRLFVVVRDLCIGSGSSCDSRYGYGYWVASISGFATTFEVLQTYLPSVGGFGFRVPYMPDGLPAAQHFDTYWGTLSRPIDFAHAHPLQCDYPATAPHVGDFLNFNDNLPSPSPGSGYYFVTAATYEGDTRYGRQTINHVTSGRDPALLPACTP